MAIVFDATTSFSGIASGATTAHTITGSNPTLCVYIINNGVLTDTVTSVTWNGNAMTRAKTDLFAAYATEYVYYISGTNCTTGTHDVIVNYTGGGTSAFGVIASFTGTASDQTSPAVVTTSTNVTATTSVTVTETPSTANSFLFAGLHNDTANFSGGTNTTLLRTGNFNAAYSTTAVAAVSSSLNATWAGSGKGFGIMMDIKPFVATNTSIGFFNLM